MTQEQQQPPTSMEIPGAEAASPTVEMHATDKNPDFVEDSEDEGAENVAIEELPPFRFYLEREPMENVENIFAYQQNGLHPVLLGDFLGPRNRFRVVHKLGAGSFGVVWLCRDEEAQAWSAVKIVRADLTEESCPEMEALDHFRGLDPAQVLEDHHIALPLETFWQQGVNGRHPCIVMPLLGPDIEHIARYYGHCTEIIKDIAFQMVEALSFMHSRNICHGDFRPHNILLRFSKEVDEWPENRIIQLLGGEPQCIPIHEYTDDGEMVYGPLPEHIPAYVVESARVPFGSAMVCTADIAVIDFGVSYDPIANPPTRSPGIPVVYSAPEEALNMSGCIGPPADVWALATSIFNSQTGWRPFQAWGAQSDGDIIGRIEGLECALGPMPRMYRAKYKQILVETFGENIPYPADDFDVDDESKFAVFRHQDRKEEMMQEAKVDHFLKRTLNLTRSLNINEAAGKAVLDHQYIPSKLALLPPFDDYWPEQDYHEPDPDYPKRYEYKLEKEDADQLFDLLMRVFRWKPEERATAAELLSHPWFGKRHEMEAENADFGLVSSLEGEVPDVPDWGTIGVVRGLFQKVMKSLAWAIWRRKAPSSESLR